MVIKILWKKEMFVSTLYKNLIILGILLNPIIINAKKNSIDEPLNYQKIVDLIKNNKIKTSQELLGNLPRSYRKQFALVFDSNNPGEASADKPRVVLVSKDGTFSMAFDTTPNQKVQSVEILEFNDNSKKLVPRVINFRNKKAFFIDKPLEVFSGNHPRNCTKCHTKNIRHIWDTYPRWFGVYGQVHLAGKEIVKETQMFRRFLRKNLWRSFFKYLPSLYKTSLHQLSEQNADISDSLTKINAKRLAALVSKSSKFMDYRADLLAAMIGSDFDNNLDLKMINSQFKSTENINEEIQKLFDRTKKSMQNYEKYIDSKFTRNQFLAVNSYTFPSSFHEDIDGFPKVIARMRFVTDKMGISMDEWWMTFKRNSYSGFAGERDFVNVFLKEYVQIIAQTDPEIVKEIPAGITYVSNRSYQKSWESKLDLIQTKIQQNSVHDLGETKCIEQKILKLLK